MTLTPIGKSTYGTAYTFDGVIPFNAPDISALNFGDTVRDNCGHGVRMYVNICVVCKSPFLAGMLILCPERGPCCSRGEDVR